MIHIRELIPSDYDLLVSLWEKAGLPYRSRGRDSREALQNQMRENPAFFLGAFMKDEMVGSIIASYDGRKGWINRVAVSPEHRRQGIAQQLISAAEEALKKRGAEVIGVLIFESNAPSLALFQRLGYETDESVLYLSKRKSTES